MKNTGYKKNIMTSLQLNIHIGLQQLFELAKQLPKKEKVQLINLLKEEKGQAMNIPEEHKQFVRNSIKKYKKNPNLLIKEEEAWKMINAEG